MLTKQVGKALVGAAVVVLWGLAPGCGPTGGSYCTKVCECVGCSEAQRDSCVDAIDDVRDYAEESQCGKEFDDYFSCVNGQFVCFDAVVKAPGCEEEVATLSSCGVPVIVGGSPCERFYATADAKYVECEVPFPTGGDQVECTDELAARATCFEPCYRALDCIVLTDPNSPQATGPVNDFNTCVTGCF